MRLLNVDSFSFTEYFGTTTPPYAIASHRWIAGAEAMLEDIRQGKKTDSAGYRKVQGFVAYLKAHMPSVKWLWIDTCCIRQISDRELSEAINSMFRWYRNAEVCLAYLHDVPTADDGSKLEDSVWFRRGWTLQELLAPTLVIFLAQDWSLIGHKGGDRGRDGRVINIGNSLIGRIAKITNIPERILQDYEESKALSVQEKLKWMEGRTTLREEDSSHCLLGILNVSMNIRYGDGEEKTRERLLRKARTNMQDTCSDDIGSYRRKLPFVMSTSVKNRGFVISDVELVEMCNSSVNALDRLKLIDSVESDAESFDARLDSAKQRLTEWTYAGGLADTKFSAQRQSHLNDSGTRNRVVEALHFLQRICDSPNTREFPPISDESSIGKTLGLHAAGRPDGRRLKRTEQIDLLEQLIQVLYDLLGSGPLQGTPTQHHLDLEEQLIPAGLTFGTSGNHQIFWVAYTDRSSRFSCHWAVAYTAQTAHRGSQR
jgi:hypothetical protein